LEKFIYFKLAKDDNAKSKNDILEEVESGKNKKLKFAKTWYKKIKDMQMVKYKKKLLEDIQ